MTAKTYTLTELDTVAYLAANATEAREQGVAERGPYTLKVFCRNDDGEIVKVYTLDHEFEESWQAGKTRKVVLANGEIDLVNAAWTDGDNYEPPAV